MDELFLLPVILFLVVLFIGYQLKADKTADNHKAVPDATMEHPELKSSLLEELFSGTYTHQFDTEVILKKDEILIISVPNVSYCEERVVGRRGGSSGVSFRVARGLWLRTGSFGSEPVEEITQLDVGDFVLTTRRLIFLGDRKLIEYPLSKILRISASRTQLAIARSGKQKIEYFAGIDALSMRGVSRPSTEIEASESLYFRIHGEDIKALVQKALGENGRAAE